jgi:hypothetical protein
MSLRNESSLMRELRDAIDDALLNAYAGGASGDGWTFMGDPITKDEMKARILEDPSKMRHINKMAAAVWAVVEARVDA